MSIDEAYIVGCDVCHAREVFDARVFLPQDALIHLVVRKGWTIYGEVAHCQDCPPVCRWCGADVDGDTDSCAGCAVTHGQS